jgi:Acyclic terpene utilisation family protein AtuA
VRTPGRPILARTSSGRRDLALSLQAARRAGVPLLIGSCGGAGTDIGVDRYGDVIRELAHELGERLRVARVYSEVSADYVLAKAEHGRCHPLTGAPSFSEETVRRSRIVAMMGVEPFQRALEEGADVVLAGRASDTSIYAAVPTQQGFDPALVWHAAKITECGSGAIGDRVGQDSILCTLADNEFIIEPLHEGWHCTPTSVAAHTLYENADPFHLVEPGGTLDTTDAVYEAIDDRRVRVTGSRYVPAPTYTVKLESSALAGYQSLMIGSVRDPVILRQLNRWTSSMTEAIHERIESSTGVPLDKYVLNVRVYGRDGTLGDLEPTPVFEGHEAMLLMDVTAADQETASSLIRLASHVAMHHGVPEWTGSITGVAHAYAPATIDRGPIYEFTLNHIIELDDPMEAFRTEFEEVGR